MMSVAHSVVLCLSLVFVFLLFSSSDARKLESKINTDVSDGCKMGNKFYRVGEKWPSPVGQCIEFTCQKGGSISGLTCPAFQVPSESGCYITEMDLKQIHPKCCPQVVCPED